MGHIEVADVGYQLPDGRPLLDEVGFRVGDGAHVALVGANGCGKTTLLRIIAGDIAAHTGTVTGSGGIGIMRQFIGTGRGVETVRDLLLSVASARVRAAASAVDRAELAVMDSDDERTHLGYAEALAEWADAGGYDAEVLWDICCTEAFGVSYDLAKYRDVMTLSGGEQKRLVLRLLLRSPEQVLILDEPDNYLDVPSKQWLEDRLNETSKTVLYVSHDRELLANTAHQIVTLEGSADGNSAWVHGAGFASYHQARLDRHERSAELGRRWQEQRDRLEELVRTLRQAKSPKTQAAVTRLQRHELTRPPDPPRQQRLRMRLQGGRTGVRALTCTDLALTGLTSPFDLEVCYGERVAVLGANGTGKSHFMRLLGGWPELDAVAHTGGWKLGARVVPGHFSQSHEHPELAGRTLLEILWTDWSLGPDQAARALNRYELVAAREQPFDTLSGGQQARLQILLLELSGATLLLLDEPTDNLDVASAEALESALDEFDGTVLAVTHDRWFAHSFDRYVTFAEDGRVIETDDPDWTGSAVMSRAE
ncbi:ATP-binding cassette domain-containing protein [Microlunatus soli]|uniref:ATPase components of ABC transporters with duplicated ATPase domains n=1 Tax=Microlunatus soli TaxID=630515 RepID=A0A1H1USU3_9ACTN|nr:ATP-binding cassette domain-containing protein [Microlunatus soli]SDS75654.1 ATPase components of ABC transporters with duplicated ATPase domains [Microlunatus soli]